MDTDKNTDRPLLNLTRHDLAVLASTGDSGALEEWQARERGGRPTTIRPAGAFGGNSQSGKVAQHGTQSGYVMHRRAAQAEHDAAGPAHAAWCAGPSTHITECQPCKDAHATYMRRPPTIGDALAVFRS
jgi:hypothetical protein